MDRGEDQFDGPFGGQPFGLQRVGEAEAADGQVGPGGAGAVQLPVHVLAFGQDGTCGQEVKFGPDQISRCR